MVAYNMGRNSLRSSLNAPEDVWTKEIDRLLAKVDRNAINQRMGKYGIIDGIYHPKDISRYRDTTNEGYNPKQTDSNACTFRFMPNGDRGRTYWTECVCNIVVSRSETWHPMYDVDVDEMRNTDHTKNGGFANGETQKYVISGVLVDPLVTRNEEIAVHHIEEQAHKVAERIIYNTEMERFYLPPFEEEKEHANEYEWFSELASIKYVGDETIRRLAQTFGLYSNLLFYKSSISAYIQSNLNSPDAQKLFSNIESAVTRYNKFREQEDSESKLKPEDVEDYPMRAPTTYHSSGLIYPPHHLICSDK